MLRKALTIMLSVCVLGLSACAHALIEGQVATQTPKTTVTYLLESKRLTSTPCITYKFATIEGLFGKKNFDVDLVSFTDVTQTVDLGLGIVYYWKLAKNVVITTGLRFMNDSKGSIVVGYSLKL